MSYMFFNCNSLSSLPDLSKWNTDNVTKIDYIFYKCESLSSLPNIAKWITNNMTYMSDMFYNCQSLSSFPDLSKWNKNNKNVNESYGRFINCIYLPPLIKKNNQTN